MSSRPRTTRLDRASAALLLGATLVVQPLAARAVESPPPEPEPQDEPSAERPPECLRDVEPCQKAHPARGLAALAGLGAFLGGAIPILFLGDRLYFGDPGLLMVGGGVVTMVGAGIGTLFGLPGTETAVAGRVERPLIATSLQPGGTGPAGDVVPPFLRVELAPTLALGAGASLRLNTYGRVQLGEELRLDRRPQVLAGDQPGEDLQTHEVGFGLAPEFALPLPYPVSASGPHTGPLELRYKPALHHRSHRQYQDGQVTRLLERWIALPLTVGLRWHLSPRQRLTLYLGPRFDFQVLDVSGERVVASGAPQLNNFYGELHYQIDVPFPTVGPVDVAGQLSLAYLQWKADGRSVSITDPDGGFALMGYMGPLQLRWDFVLREHGAAQGVQIGGGAWVGQGGGAFVEVGLTAPQLGGTI